MKKIYISLLSALGVLGLSSAYAQVSAYTFTQNAGTFTPITGGTDVNAIEVDYGMSASIPLGFSFFFDGTTYTSVKAASDGFLTFGSTTSSSTTNDLDAIGATSRPLIAALWDDLAGAASSSSQASYVVTGTAPNRVFTFEWLNWEWNYSSTGAAISFQIKLYETTNVVEMIYRGEAAAVSSGSASIGLTGVSSFMSLNGTGASPTASTSTETSNLSTKPADGQTYIFTPPTCLSPSSLSATAVTASGADLNWTETGSATTWNIEYGPTGFTQGSGTMITGSITNPTPVSTLSPATTYQFYVQADCGGGDVSAWSGPVSFTTLCGNIVPAYTQDFASYIPTCWTEAKGALQTSTTLTGTSSNWTSDGFGNNGTTGSARINIYGTTSSPNEWLISPTIDLGTGNNYQLDFDVAYTGFSGTSSATMDADDSLVLVISLDNGATWSKTNALQIWTAGSEPTNTGDHIVKNLSAYSGLVKFGFYGTSTVSGVDNNAYIDNFMIDVAPACAAPSALTAANITSGSADLSWTENGSATMWNVEYDVTGFTPTGTPTITGATDGGNGTPLNIGSLAPETTYDYYVQADCGTDQSVWVGPFTFTTPCLSVVAPWTESFDNTTIPNCWSMSGPENWLFTSSYLDHGASGLDEHTGNSGSFAGVDGSGSSNSNVILESPYIDVTALTVPALEFYYFSYNEDYPGDNNELQIDVWDGANWNTVRTVVEDSPNWVKQTIVLGGLTITGDIKVRFIVNQTAAIASYNDQVIDDVSIIEAPTCPEPYSLSLVSTIADSVIISWNAGYLETSWNIEYGPSGFTPGTGTVLPTTQSPDTITGLNLNSVYDFYIQADCGGGDVSPYTGPLTVFTEITNDDACGALFVPADGQLRYYNNKTATTQTGESSLASGSSNRTLWFKTEVPASGHVAIATCGTTFDSEIAAYEYATDCNDLTTFVEIDYADFNPWGSSTCSGVHPGGLALCGLTPGDTIVFYVGSYYSGISDAGTFPVSVWDLDEEAGTGIPAQACAGIDTINLVPLVTGTMSHFGGYFDYVTNSAAIIDDTLAAAANFTVGNDQVIYVVESDCASDTAFINITVLSQTGAGTAIDPFTSCNSDVFLMDGLTGSVESGGTWSDDAATGLLAGPNNNIFVAGGVPVGTYPFTYTVDNGVCPPTSTTVEVIIANCTDVSENDMQVSLYPNPNNGNFFIVSDKSEETSIVMTDIRGKVIYNVSTVVNAGAAFEINLNNVEAGMYMLNITSASGTKIMNVVIK